MNKSYLYTSVALLILCQLGINLYTASLPSIALYFHTSETSVKSTFYFYLIPYGISQILFNGVSYFFAFKRTILVALFIFLFGTSICLIATTMEQFIFGRIIQGFAAGTLSLVCRLIVTEAYKHNGFLGIANSYIEASATIVPSLSPFIGGFIVKYFHWHYVFILIIVYAVAVLFFIFSYAKIPHVETVNLNLSKTIADYKAVLNVSLYKFAIIGCLFSYMPVILYISNAPFMLNLSPDIFGLVMILPACAIFYGTYLSKANIIKHKPMANFKLGILLLFCSALTMLFSFKLIYLCVLSFIFAGIAYGIFFSNMKSYAIQCVKTELGSEVAILGFFQISGASLLSYLISNINIDKFLLSAIIFLASASIQLFCCVKLKLLFSIRH